MIQYVVMDCEGKPVTIEDGLKFWHEPDDGQRWNSATLQFEPDDDEPLDEYGNDVRDYGLGWYDCNSDWRTW